MNKMLRFTISLLLVLVCGDSFSQLISGPALGYCEHREVAVRLDVGPKVKGITLLYKEIKPKGSEDTVSHRGSLNYTGVLGREFNPVKLVIGGLKMNTTYEYQILINGKQEVFPYGLKFKTREYWASYMKKPIPDFSFTMGSCLYLNDSLYDRPGKPYGQDPSILSAMAETKADFSLWLGDNVYLREADHSSEYGIKYRYSKQFAHPLLNKLLSMRPNYATWDDHDFGPNDGDRNYSLKDITTECFMNYWPNRFMANNKASSGIYQKFQVADCEFFLLDDRTFRSPDEYPDSLSGKSTSKSFLGYQQMQWLKESLKASDGSFKIIVCGSQVLNKMTDKECFYHYKEEWNQLIDFIRDAKIEGVVFLSGDRHFSEIIRYKSPGMYTLYDITCSPLTSGIHSIAGKPEMDNPDRVEGSYFAEQNFGRISMTGEKGKRRLQIEWLDKSGQARWKFLIEQELLRF